MKMPSPDPATVAAHIAKLAKAFDTTPATVRRWIRQFGMSPMPSTYIVGSEISRNRRGRRAATLVAADHAVRTCRDAFGEGFREGIKRPLPQEKAANPSKLNE